VFFCGSAINEFMVEKALGKKAGQACLKVNNDLIMSPKRRNDLAIEQ